MDKFAVKVWLCELQVDSQQKLFIKLIHFVHFNTKSCYYLHCCYMTSALFGNSQG